MGWQHFGTLGNEGPLGDYGMTAMLLFSLLDSKRIDLLLAVWVLSKTGFVSCVLFFPLTSRQHEYGLSWELSSICKKGYRSIFLFIPCNLVNQWILTDEAVERHDFLICTVSKNLPNWRCMILQQVFTLASLTRQSQKCFPGQSVG